MLLLALLALFKVAIGDGFVEEVGCTADSITVVLNQSDPELARWMSDPDAQPVVYVYGHKTRVPCGTSLKNDKNESNYRLSVPYGRHCDVLLTDLEPNYRTAETTIALEDNNDISSRKTTRIHHVFCLYTRTVQTIRFNDVSTGHEVVASTGGKPKPKVDMVFSSTDGAPLRAARFGDTVEFYVSLRPDSAYHGIYPKECTFSDREDMHAPEAKRLTFVQNSCPVEDLSEIIAPLANVNEEVYVSKFKTFRFGNQSTVFVHCTVQVCLTAGECDRSCFEKVQNSNLTADRLRFRHRHRRDTASSLASSSYEPVDDVSISQTLTILDENESKQLARTSPHHRPSLPSACPLPSSSPSLLIALAACALLACVSTSTAVWMCVRMRQGKKSSFDLYSAYSASSTAAPSMASIHGHSQTLYSTHAPRLSYSQNIDPNYR